MTLEKAAKGIVTAGGGVYNIGFINSDSEEDETQFTAFNLKTLKELWVDFCKENNFKTNSVIYIMRA